MTGLTLYVPQRYRISLRRVLEPRHPGNPLGELALGIAGSAQAAQVAFDIGGKYCYSGVTEGFGKTLQGDGLACPGGARDQTVTIGQAHGLGDRLPRRIGTDKELQ